MKITNIKMQNLKKMQCAKLTKDIDGRFHGDPASDGPVSQGSSSDGPSNEGLSNDDPVSDGPASDGST